MRRCRADTVDVVSIDDPRVEGVTLYLSDFTRSITAKLSSGDLFNEARARGCASVSLPLWR